MGYSDGLNATALTLRKRVDQRLTIALKPIRCRCRVLHRFRVLFKQAEEVLSNRVRRGRSGVEARHSLTVAEVVGNRFGLQAREPDGNDSMPVAGCIPEAIAVQAWILD